MNASTTSPNRDDLLHLLHAACASGAEMERRLRRLLTHEPPAARSRKLEDLLAQTIEQQGLLRAAVNRIEDTPPPVHDSPDAATAPIPIDSGAHEAERAHALFHLREDMLREAELYARLIETAESAGFFETRFVCEGILSQKSATVEWLGMQPSRAGARQQAGR
ncbi:hypothetical protein [Burkholderia plantarii]|uniref:Uncharacterized protein n=1 Tax=Burkholderia plantarii TaxID=41899 RepID=A0A0B6RVU3_BURPL|nr:hypothetical protein [Burkholderia plantarii]AJK49452.1 hypothetical protein BGL_2c13850 [Burkholderia plantarii]